MRHGTTAMYSHGKCRCDACREAMRVSRRDYARNPRTVSSDDARLYLRMLTDAGYSLRGISTATGIYHGTLWKLWAGQSQRVTKRIEDAVFGFRQDRPMRSRCHVPAKPVARMVRTMRRHGIERPQIAAAVAMHPNTMSALLRQHHVQYRTARKVAVLYELLARQGRVPADVLEEVGA